MLNKVILMGRLTADPELRYTKSEVPVTAFSLAVNRDFKGQNGEAPVDFIDIVCWRHTAEFASNYFRKGQQVAVCGQLQTRTWQDKEGHNRKSIEVVAESVYFAEGKKGDSPKTGNGPEAEPEDDFDPDELPW